MTGVVCGGCKRLMGPHTENLNHLVCSEAGCPSIGQQHAESLPALPHTVMADALLCFAVFAALLLPLTSPSSRKISCSTVHLTWPRSWSTCIVHS